MSEPRSDHPLKLSFCATRSSKSSSKFWAIFPHDGKFFFFEDPDHDLEFSTHIKRTHSVLIDVPEEPEIHANAPYISGLPGTFFKCPRIEHYTGKSSQMIWQKGIIRPNQKGNNRNRILEIYGVNGLSNYSTHISFFKFPGFQMGQEVRAQITSRFGTATGSDGSQRNHVYGEIADMRPLEESPIKALALSQRAVLPPALVSALDQQAKEKSIFIGAIPSEFEGVSFDFFDLSKSFQNIKSLNECSLHSIIEKIISKYEVSHSGKTETDTQRKNRKTLEILQPNGKKKLTLFINLIPWMSNYARNPDGRFNIVQLHRWCNDFRAQSDFSGKISQLKLILPTHITATADNILSIHSPYECLTSPYSRSHVSYVEVIENTTQLGFFVEKPQNAIVYRDSNHLVRLYMVAFGHDEYAFPKDSHKGFDIEVKSLHLPDLDDGFNGSNHSSSEIVDQAENPPPNYLVITAYTKQHGSSKYASSQFDADFPNAVRMDIEAPFTEVRVADALTSDRRNQLLKKYDTGKRDVSADTTSKLNTIFASMDYKTYFAPLHSHPENLFVVHMLPGQGQPAVVSATLPGAQCGSIGMLSYKIFFDEPTSPQALIAHLRECNDIAVARGGKKIFGAFECSDSLTIIEEHFSYRDNPNFRTKLPSFSPTGSNSPSAIVIKALPPTVNTQVIAKCLSDDKLPRALKMENVFTNNGTRAIKICYAPSDVSKIILTNLIPLARMGLPYSTVTEYRAMDFPRIGDAISAEIGPTPPPDIAQDIAFPMTTELVSLLSAFSVFDNNSDDRKNSDFGQDPDENVFSDSDVEPMNDKSQEPRSSPEVRQVAPTFRTKETSMKPTSQSTLSISTTSAPRRSPNASKRPSKKHRAVGFGRSHG